MIADTKPETCLRRIDKATQARLDELANKNTEGALTEDEEAEFRQLVAEVHELSLENARMLLAQREAVHSA